MVEEQSGEDQPRQINDGDAKIASEAISAFGRLGAAPETIEALKNLVRPKAPAVSPTKNPST
eukprot:12041322-Alexandrium_andersonii.AAC.1